MTKPRELSYGEARKRREEGRRSPTYTREQLKTLPPLRLPKAGEDQSTFESELDARLASLAYEGDYPETECIALALWLGSLKKGAWTGFAVDLSDCKGNQGRVRFGRDLVIAAAERDKDGERREWTAKQLAPKVRGMWRRFGFDHVKATTADTFVKSYLARDETANAELLALYKADDSKRPFWMVQEDRRKLLKRELRRSAARLESAKST